jgi:hypothetical protein
MSLAFSSRLWCVWFSGCLVVGEEMGDLVWLTVSLAVLAFAGFKRLQNAAGLLSLPTGTSSFSCGFSSIGCIGSETSYAIHW